MSPYTRGFFRHRSECLGRKLLWEMSTRKGGFVTNYNCCLCSHRRVSLMSENGLTFANNIGTNVTKHYNAFVNGMLWDSCALLSIRYNHVDTYTHDDTWATFVVVGCLAQLNHGEPMYCSWPRTRSCVQSCGVWAAGLDHFAPACGQSSLNW